ncbi:hypothetical protein BJX70DRAFT_357817 [Aspergillus crustosus]
MSRVKKQRHSSVRDLIIPGVKEYAVMRRKCTRCGERVLDDAFACFAKADPQEIRYLVLQVWLWSQVLPLRLCKPRTRRSQPRLPDSHSPKQRFCSFILVDSYYYASFFVEEVEGPEERWHRAGQFPKAA